MGVLKPGGWPSRAWPDNHWCEDSWPEYGVTVTTAESIVGLRMSSPSRKHLLEADLIPLIGETLTVIARRKRKMRQENE